MRDLKFLLKTYWIYYKYQMAYLQGYMLNYDVTAILKNDKNFGAVFGATSNVWGAK